MVYTFMTDTWNLSDAGWVRSPYYLRGVGIVPSLPVTPGFGKRLSLSPWPPPLLQSEGCRPAEPQGNLTEDSEHTSSSFFQA